MLGITSLVVMMGTAPLFVNQSAVQASPVETPIVIEQNITIPLPSLATPKNTEEYVKNFFADKPILAEIAKCESTYRQFDNKGKIIRGMQNQSDVGVMQINEYYHRERAEKLGYNLREFAGNLAYAKWLYEHEGTAPWSASEKCWGKSISKK